MSSRASASPVSHSRVLVLSAAPSPAYLGLATLLILCVTLAAGAYLSFPLYDDGWLALALRESGPHFLAQHMGDRPIFGLLLERVASFGSANRLVFVLLNAVLWVGFAIQSGMLFRKLFPELKDYSIVAACLTLAPMVLQTQLSTALVAIPANLATVIAYAAILVLLRYSEVDKPNRLWLLGLAGALGASAVAISEYGVAANLVGAVILIGLAVTSAVPAARRRLFISATSLFALTVAAYLMFAKTADFSVRPDVAPAQMAHRAAAKWLEVPFDVVAGAWHALIGAYATALGNITIAWDSKSRLVGILFGLLTAILLYRGVEGRRSGLTSEDRLERLPVRLAVLLSSIFVGLLPFSAMGRPTTLLEYGSRFRIPIMPVAASLTVAVALSLVRPALRWIPVATLGLLIGYTSWTFTYSAVEQGRSISAVETALQPYVAHASGQVVAVVPFERFETELTAKVASTWPVDLEKRLWVVGEGPARTQFGDRTTCRPKAALNIQVRGLTRQGALDELLWVEVPPGKPVLVESYCETVN